MLTIISVDLSRRHFNSVCCRYPRSVTVTWEGLAALVDPTRRALYELVRASRTPVTRESAADTLAISRGLAAFHLDKLVRVGLLDARYESPAGQPRGPGRTPKVYVASSEQITVTIPARRYELLGDILVEAIAHPRDEAAGTTVDRVAREQGERLGAQARAAGTALLPLLEDLGFAPEDQNGAGLVLRNCPFQSLAAREPELVCGVNHALLTGLLGGLGETGRRAVLDPLAGACCVRLVPGE
jgi:predicted ArsR family transcriptional regulator